MLKKKERLTRKEFDRFFSVGKRSHSPSVQLIYAPSDAFHGSAVVGKKVYKKAVDRNRLRRQLYGLLYKHHKQHISPFVFILIAKPAITQKHRKEIGIEVRNLLAQVT